MPSPRVVALALVSSLGCSVAFVDRPPANHASLPYFDCTSSRLAPATDTVLTGLLGLAALGSVTDGTRDATATVEITALAAAALGSAAYGYMNVSRCRDAKDALRERMVMGSLVRPPPYVPAAPLSLQRPGADPWLAAGPPPAGPVAPPPPAAPPGGPADAGAREGGAP